MMSVICRGIRVTETAQNRPTFRGFVFSKTESNEDGKLFRGVLYLFKANLFLLLLIVLGGISGPLQSESHPCKSFDSQHDLKYVKTDSI